MKHYGIQSAVHLLAGIAVALAGISTAADVDLAGSRPNIILVITDDQGMGDLSCMGNEIVKTPNIDRFYEKATRFTDFQVNPTCAPTRAAMMSGRAPFKNGVTHTISQRERMALDVYALPQALASAGYETGIFGKWHLGDEDAYLPGTRRPNGRTVKSLSTAGAGMLERPRRPSSRSARFGPSAGVL